MATVKFRLRNNKKERATISTHLSIGKDKQFLCSTGLTINSKDWKSTNKSLTGFPKNVSNPNIKNLKTDLSRLETHLLIEANNANTQGTIINSNWLKEEINNCFNRKTDKEINKSSVTSWIQHYIDNANTFDNAKGGIGLSLSRVKAYKTFKKTIESYNKNLIVSDCGTDTFDHFKKWLIKQLYAPTTLNKKLSDLRTVCKYAQSKGIEVSNELNVIKIKKGNPYDDDMDVITLTELDIKKIEDLKLTKLSLINARKWLILACYTGQRGTALTERIVKENFKLYKDNDLTIRIKQKKGNKTITIPVLPRVKEIYENGLPHKISLQKFNDYTKEIGRLAEIDEPTIGTIRESIKNSKNETIQRNVKEERPKWKYIASHIGRRTFATIHYNKLTTPIIMQVTGHSKESTFLEYINQTGDDHLDAFLDYYKNKEEPKETKIIEMKTVNK